MPDFKCVNSHRHHNEGGGYKDFQAGKTYPAAEIPDGNRGVFFVPVEEAAKDKKAKREEGKVDNA